MFEFELEFVFELELEFWANAVAPVNVKIPIKAKTAINIFCLLIQTLLEYVLKNLSLRGSRHMCPPPRPSLRVRPML
jgi:hypothetical protein